MLRTLEILGKGHPTRHSTAAATPFRRIAIVASFSDQHKRHGTWTEYFKIFQVRPCLPVEGEVFAHFREHPRSKGNITSRRSLDLDRLGMLISSSCLFDPVAHELVENNWSGSFLYVVVFWSTSRVTCETLGHSRKVWLRKVFRKHPTWIVGNALQKTSNLDVTGLEGIPCHALPSYIRYM